MEEIVKIFSNPILQKKIAQVEKKYAFLKQEDIYLKSLLLTFFLLTNSEKDLHLYFDRLVSEIVLHRDSNCYDKILYSMIDLMLEEKTDSYAFQILDHFIINGYCFHSFNACFLPEVNQQGLLFQTKSWESKITEIQNLFLRYGKKNIFGLYKNKGNTPLYFAQSLKPSMFYAYTSPSWFYHFTSGGMQRNPDLYDKNVFMNRDYEGARKNIMTLIQQCKFNFDDAKNVLSFFMNCWELIATTELPCLALLKRSEIETIQLLPIQPEEKIKDYVKRMIVCYCQGNYTVRKNIPREKLLLFPYQLESIEELNDKKYIKSISKNL